MDAREDRERQRAAREAVMALDPFPLLESLLVALYGPAAGIFLHQLLYWFRKPGMQHREWIYKTYAEWRAERGLTRRWVDRARRELVKAGVLEEVKGPYKRLHYRINWVRLAEALNLTLNPTVRPEPAANGVGKPQTPENGRAVSDCTAANGHEPHSHAGESSETRVQSRLHAPEADFPASPSGEPSENGVQSNTREYAGEYLQEISSYRARGGRLRAERSGASLDLVFQEGQEPDEDHPRDFDASPPSGTGEQDDAEEPGAGDQLPDHPDPIRELPRFDPDTDALYAAALRLTGDAEHPAGRLARRHLAGEDVFEELLLAVAGGNPVQAELSRARVRVALEELEAA